MLYYLSLNEREFPLALTGSSSGGYRVEGTDGTLTVEVLSRSEHGRPALVLVDGCVYRVRAAPRPKGSARDAAPARAVINGRLVRTSLEAELERRARPNRNTAANTPSQVNAPMPGRVVKVNVRAGDVVAAGDPLLGIEAMKMENELLAPSAGRVSKVTVSVGSTVEADQELVVIEPS